MKSKHTNQVYNRLKEKDQKNKVEWYPVDSFEDDLLKNLINSSVIKSSDSKAKIGSIVAQNKVVLDSKPNLENKDLVLSLEEFGCLSIKYPDKNDNKKINYKPFRSRGLFTEYIFPELDNVMKRNTNFSIGGDTNQQSAINKIASGFPLEKIKRKQDKYSNNIAVCVDDIPVSVEPLKTILLNYKEISSSAYFVDSKSKEEESYNMQNMKDSFVNLLRSYAVSVARIMLINHHIHTTQIFKDYRLEALQELHDAYNSEIRKMINHHKTIFGIQGVDEKIYVGDKDTVGKIVEIKPFSKFPYGGLTDLFDLGLNICDMPVEEKEIVKNKPTTSKPFKLSKIKKDDKVPATKKERIIFNEAQHDVVKDLEQIVLLLNNLDQRSAYILKDYLISLDAGVGKSKLMTIITNAIKADNLLHEKYLQEYKAYTVECDQITVENKENARNAKKESKPEPKAKLKPRFTVKDKSKLKGKLNFLYLDRNMVLSDINNDGDRLTENLYKIEKMFSECNVDENGVLILGMDETQHIHSDIRDKIYEQLEVLIPRGVKPLFVNMTATPNIVGLSGLKEMYKNIACTDNNNVRKDAYSKIVDKMKKIIDEVEERYNEFVSTLNNEGITQLEEKSFENILHKKYEKHNVFVVDKEVSQRDINTKMNEKDIYNPYTMMGYTIILPDVKDENQVCILNGVNNTALSSYMKKSDLETCLKKNPDMKLLVMLGKENAIGYDIAIDSGVDDLVCCGDTRYREVYEGLDAAYQAYKRVRQKAYGFKYYLNVSGLPYEDNTRNHDVNFCTIIKGENNYSVSKSIKKLKNKEYIGDYDQLKSYILESQLSQANKAYEYYKQELEYYQRLKNCFKSHKELKNLDESLVTMKSDNIQMVDDLYGMSATYKKDFFSDSMREEDYLYDEVEYMYLGLIQTFDTERENISEKLEEMKPKRIDFSKTGKHLDFYEVCKNYSSSLKDADGRLKDFVDEIDNEAEFDDGKEHNNVIQDNVYEYEKYKEKQGSDSFGVKLDSQRSSNLESHRSNQEKTTGQFPGISQYTKNYRDLSIVNETQHEFYDTGVISGEIKKKYMSYSDIYRQEGYQGRY